MKNKKIKYEKKSCIYATYYNVSYEDKGSIKLWVENNNHSELFLSNLFVSLFSFVLNKSIGLIYSEHIELLFLRKFLFLILLLALIFCFS